MFKGYLDQLTSAGYAEGWAYDMTRPDEPITVSLVYAQNRSEIAQGIANGYRGDLVAAGCGSGWCAFRLKLGELAQRLQGKPLSLLERRSGLLILTREWTPLVALEETPLAALPDVIAADPTLLHSLGQLEGCRALFERFIDARGVDAFVRAAYIFLLNRPADPSGLASYGDHLRAKTLTPFGLLLAIAEGDEYRASARQHVAPTMPSFPFRID